MAADPVARAFFPPAELPPLAEPPIPEGAWAALGPWLRRSLGVLNRTFMVPLHRAGLGAWLSTPIGGYMLLLRVRGRKSGVVREAPVSYLVAEGSAWVMAGFGPRTEWYRNLRADPKVEVWMPGGRQVGTATEELDPAVRARIIPALTRATGLPALMIGTDPWSAPDAEILDRLRWVPLIRIRPDAGPLEAGPDDPGGHMWIWRQAVALAASWLAWRVVRRSLGCVAARARRSADRRPR